MNPDPREEGKEEKPQLARAEMSSSAPSSPFSVSAIVPLLPSHTPLVGETGLGIISPELSAFPRS